MQSMCSLSIHMCPSPTQVLLNIKVLLNNTCCSSPTKVSLHLHRRVLFTNTGIPQHKIAPHQHYWTSQTQGALHYTEGALKQSRIPQHKSAPQQHLLLMPIHVLFTYTYVPFTNTGTPQHKSAHLQHLLLLANKGFSSPTQNDAVHQHRYTST